MDGEIIVMCVGLTLGVTRQKASK